MRTGYPWTRLSDIDPKAGVLIPKYPDRAPFMEERFPLTAASKIAIEKLQAYLGEAASEISPVFVRDGQGKAHLTELHHSVRATDVASLHKLDDLLKGTGNERPLNQGFDYTATQTAAIVAAIPAIGRQVG